MFNKLKSILRPKKILLLTEDQIVKSSNKLTWPILRPIFDNLDELEKNTWDKDRIYFIREYLRENFRVRR